MSAIALNNATIAAKVAAPSFTVGAAGQPAQANLQLVNSSTQQYKIWAPSASVSGLTATHLEAWSYTSGADDCQAFQVTPQSGKAATNTLVAPAVTIPGHLTVGTAGTVPCSGTLTLNGTTAVVVANSNVTANSVILMTLKTVGGTPAGAPYLSAVTAGTGFSVKAAAGDTSVMNYLIIN